MSKHFLMCALFSCTLLGLKAQSLSQEGNVYSAKLQNSSASPQDISVYLKNIAGADSVAIMPDNTYYIYTKRVLDEKIIGGKLQKNFMPLLSLELKNSGFHSSVNNTVPSEVLSKLEGIYTAKQNNFASAPQITFYFNATGREKFAETEKKITEHVSSVAEKIKLVSITDGTVTLQYINVSAKEIMQLFNERELPALYFSENQLDYYLVENNQINKL